MGVKSGSTVKALEQKHPELIHSTNMKVQSHVQRNDGDWFVHTLMLNDHNVPFQFKRPSQLKDLTGTRVNISYYPLTKDIAGLPFETMKVVRIRRA